MDNTAVELQFREALFRKYSKCEKHLLPRDVYYQTISDLRLAATTETKKSRHQYYLLSKYEILQCGDVEKLIKKRESPEERPVYYVTIEDTYDIIQKTHISTGHGGRDRMLKHIKEKYANITKDSLELFKSYCVVCQEKRNFPKTKGVVVKPILSSEFNSRAQVDLIDMQSLPQGQYKWIMVYQCHLTKFVVLRPLTSKRAAAVAYQLLDIFLLFGAPAILQSDNGSEFIAQVITELKELWPQLVMVHGKPRHPQSQGSVERANSDIKDILVAWISDNNTKDWTVGLKFTQQQKNCSHHAGINQTPYKALFGENPKVRLTSSSLPSEILERLQSEDDLLAICGQQNTADEQQPTPARTDEPQPTSTRTEEPQPTPSRTDEPQLTPARTNEQQPQSSRTDEQQPTSVRTDQTQPTSARTKEPQLTSARTNEPQPIPSTSDGPQPTPARPTSHNLHLLEPTTHNLHLLEPTSHNLHLLEPTSHNLHLLEPTSHNQCLHLIPTWLNGTKQYSSRERGLVILNCRKLREWSKDHVLS